MMDYHVVAMMDGMMVAVMDGWLERMLEQCNFQLYSRNLLKNMMVIVIV